MRNDFFCIVLAERWEKTLLTNSLGRAFFLLRRSWTDLSLYGLVKVFSVLCHGHTEEEEKKRQTEQEDGATTTYFLLWFQNRGGGDFPWRSNCVTAWAATEEEEEARRRRRGDVNGFRSLQSPRSKRFDNQKKFFSCVTK